MQKRKKPIILIWVYATGFSIMDILITLFIFLAGLVFGSFINVVIYRLPEGKSIVTPRSACTSCGNALVAKDLIPVFSFLLLKGKCRYCGARISFRYPLVEFVTGVIFVILFYKFGISVEFFFTVYLMSILVIVFFIDLDHMIIPNELVIAGLLGGVAFFIVRFWVKDRLIGNNALWYSPLLGMLVTSGFLLLIALIGAAVYGTDAFGMGDVKIFLPIGLILGFRLAVMSLIFSVFIGGFAGLFLIITGLKNRKSQIPFGPFIVSGTFLAILFGHEIISWYLGFL